MPNPEDYLSDAIKGRTMLTRLPSPPGLTEHELEAIPGMEVCDACSDPNPRWQYECGDFAITTIMPDGRTHTDVSDDAWLMCEECAACVEADDRKSLLDRAVAALADRSLSPSEQMLVRGEIARIHRGFFAAKGERHRWEGR